MADYLRFAKAAKDAMEAMTTTTQQSTTEPPCTNSCSGCKNCDHHFYLRDNGQLQCKHCLYSRPVTRFEVDAISLVGQWNYEEPFWWAPIATALAKEFREGQARAALRQYFCSCGGALTAEEYITHYFELGHDRGDPVHENSIAFKAYNQAVEDAKAAIRAEKVDDPYAAPTFINAIARKCSPHVYVNRLASTAAKSCGFCGKSDQEVKVLIQAAIGYICEECVAICAGIIEQERAGSPVEQTVYVSEHPVTLRCNTCGLVQVKSFKCPRGDGQLVVDVAPVEPMVSNAPAGSPSKTR